MRGWENIFHANGKQKTAGVAILISDKIYLKIKKITKDKEGHYIIIKGSIQEEDITIDKDIKWEIDSNAIIVGDFNTPLTPMDGSSKQKM